MEANSQREPEEHEMTDCAKVIRVEIGSKPNCSNATYNLRKRALLRMDELGLSVEKYMELLKREPDELEYLRQDGKPFKTCKAALYRWQGIKDDKFALSRGRGGTGRASQIPNWVVCFILEKLHVDPKARCSDIYFRLKEFANHHDFYLPAHCTISRFLTAIKKKGGIQDMLHKLKTRRYFSAYQLAVRHFYSHSNHIWETDATAIPILISDTVNTVHRKRVWLLLTIDCFSGLLVGSTLVHGDPKTNDLLVHLHHCLVHEKDKFWGGKPVILQSDNARIYDSRGFLAACDDLGVQLRKSPPYCPAFNGCIERVNQTLKGQLKSCFVDPIKRHRLFSERNEAFLGSFADLTDIVTKCVHEYNTVRGPSGTSGTYVGNWQAGLKTADDGFLDVAEADRCCLGFDEVTVTRSGVRVRGIDFSSEQLLHFVGKKIPVRSNLFGAPNLVLGQLSGEWVILRRNSDADRSFVAALKKSRTVELSAIRDVAVTLSKTSLASMQHHTPGTDKALRSPKPKRIKEAALPEKPMTIPTLRVAKIRI